MKLYVTLVTQERDGQSTWVLEWASRTVWPWLCEHAHISGSYQKKGRGVQKPFCWVTWTVTYISAELKMLHACTTITPVVTNFDGMESWKSYMLRSGLPVATNVRSAPVATEKRENPCGQACGLCSRKRHRQFQSVCWRIESAYRSPPNPSGDQGGCL
jgi:hypothetical protein